MLCVALRRDGRATVTVDASRCVRHQRRGPSRPWGGEKSDRWHKSAVNSDASTLYAAFGAGTSSCEKLRRQCNPSYTFAPARPSSFRGAAAGGWHTRQARSGESMRKSHSTKCTIVCEFTLFRCTRRINSRCRLPPLRDRLFATPRSNRQRHAPLHPRELRKEDCGVGWWW